jgi:osmotically-inducible protein OsmY
MKFRQEISMKHTIRNLTLTTAIAMALGVFGTNFAAEPKPQDRQTQPVVDARLESQIQTGFGMNRHLRAFDLSVKVEDSKAVLNGKVEDNADRDLAEQIAMSAEGIKHVDNHIVVDADLAPRHASSDRSFGEKVEDATITASVKSKLLWNSPTDGLDIHVETISGKVMLTGSVTSSGEKDRAGRIARDTDGVVGLSNEIALSDKPDTSAKLASASTQAEQQVTDSWITTKVKSSLMFTRGVDGFDISVTTVSGVVSLSGVLDSTAERDRAVKATQDIRGVKRVDSARLKVG